MRPQLPVLPHYPSTSEGNHGASSAPLIHHFTNKEGSAVAPTLPSLCCTSSLSTSPSPRPSQPPIVCTQTQRDTRCNHRWTQFQGQFGNHLLRVVNKNGDTTFCGLFFKPTDTLLFTKRKKIKFLFLNMCLSSFTRRFNTNNSAVTSIASCQQPPCVMLTKLPGYSFKKKGT